MPIEYAIPKVHKFLVQEGIYKQFVDKFVEATAADMTGGADDF